MCDNASLSGLCYGLSACSPFKGNARRSLLSSSLLSGKYPAFSLCVNFEKIPAETFDEVLYQFVTFPGLGG